MVNRRLLTATLAILFVFATPRPALAASDSLRATFVKDDTTRIDLVKDGIRVVGYRFARVVRGGARPFKMGSGPTIHFDVKNEGTEPKDFGLAVALFDRDGRLVGAGTGSQTGKLDPGEDKEVKVVFQDVSQDVPRAATIIMTLEIHR